MKTVTKFLNDLGFLFQEKIGILLLAILTFYSNIWFLFVSIGMCIALDWITGVYKSIKIKGWSSFKSKRIRDTAGKVLMYQLIVLTLFPIDKLILNDVLIKWLPQFALTKTITLFLIYIECVSIKENIEEAFGIHFYGKLKVLFKVSKELKHDFEEITKKHSEDKDNK